MARWSTFTWCAALCAVGGAIAQSFKSQVNISMCSWDRFRANIIRDIIYLDGGDLYWQRGLSDGTLDAPASDKSPYSTVYSLQLGKPFDTSTTNLTGLFEDVSSSDGAANNIAPNTVDGAMLANDYKFFLYGGLLSLTDSYDNPPDANDVVVYEAYQYGPVRTSWTPGFLIGSTGDDVNRYVTNGAAASAPSEQLGFYFSGMRAEDWGPIVEVPPTANTSSRRLVSVDMSEMRNDVWSNATLPDHIPARASGELVWVPVADSGVLIAIGGVTYPEDIFAGGLSDDQIEENESTGPGFMATLPVYDIASEEWYMQNTTGEAPPPLAHFCSVVAAASDKSSFNIYIYGGYDGTNRTQPPSDDVYILSVPSFTWIKAYEGQSDHGRSGHKCIKTYPDKMFVLGGQYLGSNTCVDGGIIQVFNLNTLRFQESYDPDDWEEYQVPELVTAQIGGDGGGGAETVEPEEWSDDALSDAFGTEYTKTIETYYPYSATGTAAPSSTGTGQDEGSNDGGGGGGGGFPKWAGAVIGVVLGLVVISIIVIFWLLWRRRHRRRNSKATLAQSEGATSDNRKRILGWMYGIVQPHKPDMTNATSTELGINEKPTAGMSEAGGESVASPRATSTAVFSDTTTHEAGSVAVHEMIGEHAGPSELPTEYNIVEGVESPATPTQEPQPIDTPSEGRSPVVSPAVSPTPDDQATRDQAQERRPAHYRNHSSVSSAGVMGLPASLNEVIARDDTEQQQEQRQQEQQQQPPPPQQQEQEQQQQPPEPQPHEQQEQQEQQPSSHSQGGQGHVSVFVEDLSPTGEEERRRDGR